jgi:hypothetical protein
MLKKNLEQREKPELIAIIQHMLRQEPELQWLLMTPLPTVSARKSSVDPEAYRQQVLAAMAAGENQRKRKRGEGKTSTASLPESLKMEVTTKANEHIETVLKPKYIPPPPENPQFNYIVDIFGKWYQKAFYFSAEYRVAGPHPIESSFDAKFARMQYAGNRRFHLSFMRHTGQWIQLYTDLTVEECIETIRDDPYFFL